MNRLDYGFLAGEFFITLIVLLCILHLQVTHGTYKSIISWNSRITFLGKTIIFITCFFLWPWILSTNLMDLVNKSSKSPRK